MMNFRLVRALAAPMGLYLALGFSFAAPLGALAQSAAAPSDQGAPAPLPVDGSTLAPPPADAANPDEVNLAAKPAALTRGQATWDEGFGKLTDIFARLARELEQAGIKVAGKPIAIFVETDDAGFRYEALLPITAEPASRPAGLPADIQFGSTPSGRAIRFLHQAPYDDIDGAYEALTAYLDSKDIEVKDAFIEEYVTPGKDAADPALQVYIYVQPK